MNFRKIIRVIHRDLGYLCVGGMLVYAVSGVLLNHIHDFNSNYRIVRDRQVLEASLAARALTPAGVKEILDAVGEERPASAVFQPDSSSLQIFVEGNVVEVDLERATAAYERVAERPILKGMNDLHLNRAGRLWTWVADIYAAALGLLAFTGLFVLSGKQGFKGRGAWLTGVGVLLPLVLGLLFL